LLLDVTKLLKMRIIIIFFTSLLCVASAAQSVVIDNNLNKFVGTWRWTSGTDTVEIVLQKQVYNIPMTGSNSEALAGWHRYVKNGVLVQSSLQYTGRDINIDFNSHNVDFKTTLNGFTHPSQPQQVYFILFWDLTLHKSFELFFTMLPNSTTQARWELKQPRGIYTGPEGLNGVFTLPKHLVLNKL
jgi:hypothetical protein